MAALSDPLTIYGVGTTRTFRVHWMAHELGLDYETRRIESRTGETQDETYTRLNPRQKIPFLVHGDLALAESYAITHYLRSLTNTLPYDEYQLTLEGRAKYDEWLSYILMELDATSLYVVRRHKDLPEIYGEAPAAVHSSIEYFNRMMNAIVEQVRPAQPLWGSCFSELDILLTVALDWAIFLDIKIPANIAEYREEMASRPAYGQAQQHNFRDLKIATIRQ